MEHVKRIAGEQGKNRKMKRLMADQDLSVLTEPYYEIYKKEKMRWKESLLLFITVILSKIFLVVLTVHLKTGMTFSDWQIQQL